jgi:hypothetical protein
MRSAVAGLTGLCFLLLASSASAQERVVVVGFDDSGDPLLNAHVEPTARGSVTEWRRCAPDGSPCVPLPQSAYDAAAGKRLDSRAGRRPAAPGDTPAGTTFEAAFVVDGVPSTVRTQPWTGHMMVAAQSSAGPNLSAGAAVSFTRPIYSGGWNPAPPESPYASSGAYYVCPQLTGGDCYSISTPRLRARYGGWYVFTQYTLAWRDPGLPVAVPSAAPAGDFPVRLTLSPTGSVDRLAATSGAQGPICCPTPFVIIEPPILDPVRPTATITARAPRRKGRTVVGSVTCGICTVQLTVRGGGRAAVKRTIKAKGKTALTVPVRRGRLRVTVIVDGRPVAAGTTEAR